MADENRSRRAQKLYEAKFDPRLKTYTNIATLIILTVTVAGIVLIPFWLIFGRRYMNRYFDALYCELTTRALHFKKGVWFQTERTIPLDKIQDLTFKEGPVLRHFGLSQLQVETAGQTMQGTSDMSLTGIIDARAFREMVLDQRNEITDKNSGPITAPIPNDNGHELLPILQEIQNTLVSIDQKIGQKPESNMSSK
jgi:membrane protein YdbS with pleckstrin-like domain